MGKGLSWIATGLLATVLLLLMIPVAAVAALVEVVTKPIGERW